MHTNSRVSCFWPTGAERSLWISPNFLRICGGCRLPFLISVDRGIWLLLALFVGSTAPPFLRLQSDRDLFLPSTARARPGAAFNPTVRRAVTEATRANRCKNNPDTYHNSGCPSASVLSLSRAKTNTLPQAEARLEACSHAPAKLCGIWTSPLVRYLK